MEAFAESGPLLIGLALTFGLFMTWGIGANDVANTMGTSVGSGALSPRRAITVAAIFELLGAFLGGGRVTETVRGEILDPASVAATPEIVVYGMIATLLAGGLWLALASRRGWPVSTTHTIIGALAGFGIAGLGIGAVRWDTLLGIGASWILSPLLGGLLAYLLMSSVRLLILDTAEPQASARRWAPAYVFLVGFTITLVTLFGGLTHLNLTLTPGGSVLIAGAVGLALAGVGRALTGDIEAPEQRERDYQFASVEQVFAPMMVFAACAMAFAHGSNDVANGVGPVAAVLDVVRSGEVGPFSMVPGWLLALGGLGIVSGILTYGARVIVTLGSKITALTPTRGFCATLGAAITVALASRAGLPVSTTHIVVGAIMGVGMARGIGAMDLRVLGGMFLYWAITLPMSGLFGALFFWAIQGALG